LATSSTLSARWWCVFPLLACLVAGCGPAGPSQPANAPALTSPAAQSPGSIAAALDHPITADFHHAPVPEVLAELSRQSGVAIRAEGKEMADEAWTTWMGATFRVRGMRLESVLNLLAEACGLAWRSADGGIMLSVVVQPELSSVVYPLSPPLLGAHPSITGRRFDERALAEALRAIVAPDSWNEAGGDGYVRAVPGALVVTQTADIQRQVADFLNGLRRMADFREPWSQGQAEAARSPATAALHQTLDRRVTIAVDDMPVPEFLDKMAREQGINIVWSDLNFGWGPPGWEAERVTIHASDKPLRSVLSEALKGLEITPIPRHGAVLLLTNADVERLVEWRMVPLPDQALSVLGMHRQDDPEHLIRHLVSMELWSEVGGPGEARVVPGGLAVLQTDEGHRQVARFLAALTQAVDPEVVGRIPALTPAEQAIEDAYQRNVSVDWTDKPLGEGIAELIVAAGLPPPLIDDRALDDAGLDLNVTWTARLEDLPLRSALTLIGEQFEVAVISRDGQLVVTAEEIARTELNLRVFRMHGTLRGSLDEYALDELLQMNDPAAWDSVGGPGAMEAVDNFLFVAQNERAMRKLDAALQAINEALAYPPSDDCRPFPRDSPAAASLQLALAQSTTIDVTDMPLNDLLEHLADRHGLNGRYLIDARGFGDAGVTVDAPASITATDKPLANVLDGILHPLKLDWNIRENVLFITTAEEADSATTLLVYPIPWLPGSTDESSLENLVEDHDVPESWDHVGGPGDCDYLPKHLVVAQSRAGHLQIAMFLEELSAIVSGQTYRYRPTYAAEWPPDVAASGDVPLVLGAGHWLRPAGPLTVDELAELTAAAIGPTELRSAQGIAVDVFAGALVASPGSIVADRLRGLLSDQGGCMSRLVRFHRQWQADDPTPAFRAALADPSPAVRCCALSHLAEMTEVDGGLAPQLTAALADPDRAIRLAAVLAIEKIAPPPTEAALPLAELLRGEDDHLQAIIFRVLAGFGPRAHPALPVLGEVFADMPADKSRLPLLALFPAIGPAAVPLVAEFLAPDGDRFLDACGILQELGPHAAAALPQLRQALLTNPNPFRRRLICQILVDLGPAAEEAIPDLIELLGRPIEGRDDVCETLAAIGRRPDEVVPALAALAVAPAESPLRYAACRALGEFGPAASGALPTLIQVERDDPVAHIRAAAGTAIERIQAPDDLPPDGDPSTPAPDASSARQRMRAMNRIGRGVANQTGREPMNRMGRGAAKLLWPRSGRGV
jgi:HEAT repeat protein